MAFPGPQGGAVTGANLTNITTTGYASDSTLSPAIQQIWSKEILFQAMPVLRFEQFAVKKTELGVMPGLTINFMRYNNLSVDNVNAAELTEGVRLEPVALSASQIQITVKEHGQAVAVTELLLNASFDDVMASASRLLGRHMAQSMDIQARNTLYSNGIQFVYLGPA
jgi:N4-gp56 family major capsid protein